MDGGDFQVCRNCKKSVASTNLVLHEAHCLRFLVHSPESKEPQSKEKLEAHLKSEHQGGRAVALKTTELQEHVACQLGELALSSCKLGTHEHYHGKQMEQCMGCGWSIPLQGLAQHRKVCQNEWSLLKKGNKGSVSKKKIHCHRCNQLIPANYYSQHMNKCHAVTESTESLPVGIARISTQFLPNQTAKDYPSTANKDVRPKTKNSKTFPSLSENSTKKTPRGTDRSNDIPLKSNHNAKLSSSVVDAAYNIMRSCSQCGILLPLPILSQHQEKCRWLTSLKEKQVRDSNYIWQRKETDLFQGYK